VEIHKSRKVHSVQFDRTKQIENEQETEDGLEFQLGGDDEPHGWLTVYFADFASSRTVLTLTSWNKSQMMR
jgi:hypothetical protein